MRLLAWTLVLVGACAGPKPGDDTAGTDTHPEGDADTDADTDADADADTITIQGTATLTERDQPPAPEGACVHALDSSQAREGEAPDELAAAPVGPGGAYTLNDVRLGELPPIIFIDDCEQETPRFFKTATPIPPDMTAGVSDGGVVSGVRSAVVSLEMLEALELNLAAAGSDVDLTVDGVMLGFVWEGGEEQTPIAGATLSCGGCTVYYGDEDPTDGAFLTGRTLNTSTSGQAFYVAPGASVGDYTATAAGFSFDTYPAGAPPEAALFMPWIGRPE